MLHKVTENGTKRDLITLPIAHFRPFATTTIATRFPLIYEDDAIEQNNLPIFHYITYAGKFRVHLIIGRPRKPWNLKPNTLLMHWITIETGN